MHHSFSQANRRTATLLALALSATGLATGLAAVPASAGSGSGATATRVVVTSLTGDVAGAARAVSSAGGRVLDRLSLIGGVSATLPTGAVLAPTFRVVPDRPLKVAAAEDSSSSVATGIRSALGLGRPHGEGKGITVAVVDTGVADVPDLADRVTHVNVTQADSGDGYGHGTFVAGLVAGDGSSSEGLYAGVAPAARILDVKVADSSGGTDLVTVLTGLQRLAGMHVDVVNLSLSSGSPLPYQIDPLSAALDSLWRNGVTVVVPSGNDGEKGAGTIASPGNDPLLLTAGGLDTHGTAATADDTVASWSGRGPAPQGVQKPDLVAPGAHVVSLRVAGSSIDSHNPSGLVAGAPAYFKGSGTSFATAAASGAVAALLAERPGLSPSQVKAVVTDSARGGKALRDKDAAGAGALDLAAAYDAKAKKYQDGKDDDSSIAPGDPALWAAFLDALLSGNEEAAASSWSTLSQAARNWAASSWSELSPDARNWAARNWAARNWAGATAEQWAARNWAARNWAARNWADSDWSASGWSAGNWAAGNWAASSWSARNWAAGNWATADWSAGNWAASSWSARNWAAGNWAAGNWAAGNWAASSWSAIWH